MTAPSTLEKCDTLALGVRSTGDFAGLRVGDSSWRAAEVHLTGACVAHGLGRSLHPTVRRRGRCGGDRVCNQSERASLALPFCLGACRAEVAAPPTVEVRDALAPCGVLARLLALREAQAFSRRVRQVHLTGSGVTRGFGTNHPPRTFHIDAGCSGRDAQSVHDCIFLPFGLGARRAEVTAPPAIAIPRDALAPRRALTRLLALREG